MGSIDPVGLRAAKEAVAQFEDTGCSLRDVVVMALRVYVEVAEPEGQALSENEKWLVRRVGFVQGRLLAAGFELGLESRMPLDARRLVDRSLVEFAERWPKPWVGDMVQAEESPFRCPQGSA